MPYIVGVDLGTTFTSVAVNTGGHATPFALTENFVVPSVAYRTATGTLLTGRAAIDAAVDPSRLVVGFKRRLGDPTPILVGGAVYSAEALMAAQLRDVLELVEASQGGAPDLVVLTYPAVWGPYRREQFLAVAKLAGVETSRVVTEPVATATHLVENDDQVLAEGDIVAVYDLGGGTLDITILRAGATGLEILGSPEGVEHLGGMDFDDALAALVDERLSGRLAGPDVPASVRAAVAAACTRAKEALSTRESVDITVDLPGGRETVTITRSEFEGSIDSLIDLSVATLRRVIASAGIDVADVSAVMLAGSSSRIPIVGERVAELGPPVHLTHQPKLTVCLGAASSASSIEPESDTGDDALPTKPVDSIAVAPVRSTARGAARRTPRRRGIRSAIGAGAVVLALVGALTLSTSLRAALGPDALAQPAESASPTATALVPAPENAVTINPSTVGDASSQGTADITGQGAPNGDAPDASKTSDRSRFTVFNSEPAQGLTVFVESGTNGNENWSRTPLQNGSASRPQLTASQDGSGLRTVWRSSLPGQLYLQTSTGSLDMNSLADANGALVFAITVHGGRAQELKVGAHCGFPCGATIDLTERVAAIPAGTTTEIAVPASCLRASGLNTGTINTPFVALGSGTLDATFSDIRWEASAAGDPTAVRC